MRHITDYSAFLEVKQYIHDNYDNAYYLAFCILCEHDIELSQLFSVKVRDLTGFDEDCVYDNGYPPASFLYISADLSLSLSASTQAEALNLIQLRNLNPYSYLFVTKRGCVIQYSSFSRMLCQTAKALDVEGLTTKSLHTIAVSAVPKKRPFSKASKTLNNEESANNPSCFPNTCTEKTLRTPPRTYTQINGPAATLYPSNPDFLSEFCHQQLLSQIEDLESIIKKAENNLLRLLPYLTQEDIARLHRSLESIVEQMNASIEKFSV